jgi:hypothetical protein
MTISTIIKLTGLAIISGGLYFAFQPKKQELITQIKNTTIQRIRNETEIAPRLIKQPTIKHPEPYEIIVEEHIINPLLDEVMVITEPYRDHRCGCQPSYGHLIELDSIPELIEEPIEYLFSEQEIIDPYIFETNVYPNPTIGEATVDIDIDNEDTFIIEVYNMNGQLIQQLHNGMLDAGRQSFKIELYDYPTGLYIIQVASPTQVETLKLQKVG